MGLQDMVNRANMEPDEQEAERRFIATGMFYKREDGMLGWTPAGVIWLHLAAILGGDRADQLCKEVGLLPADC